ncbi:MAG: hypothetical protein WBW08_01495 [Methyloceanibacter sp.]
MKREISDGLEVSREGVHLLSQMVGIELHRLAKVLALGKFECHQETGIGISPGYLRYLSLERDRTVARKLGARRNAPAGVFACLNPDLEGPMGLFDAQLDEVTEFPGQV